MRRQWYYSHDGATHGPFSEQEIKEHAARKVLLESDWLWQGDAQPRDAVQAGAALDFLQISSAASPVPDWLADLAAVESKGALPGPLPSEEIPEWLEDLRLWVGLDLYAPAMQSSAEMTTIALSDATLAGAIPDWLESWMAPEKPGVAQQDQAPPAPAAPPIPVVLPVVPALPSVPSQPPIAPLAAVPTSRVAAPTGDVKPFANPRQTRLQARGIDVETGRILDPEQFHKWKRQQAQPASIGQPAVSNASLFEAFRNARTAIYRWADDEANHACVMQAEPEEIKRQPEIQLILHEYANYGKGMQEKLLRHLEFMVETRRKYYNAMQERRRQNMGDGRREALPDSN
jgi:hypothetical protein